MNNDKLPCRDMSYKSKPFAQVCPAIRELTQITKPVERYCEFKQSPVCRLYSICVRVGFGPRENTVNNCPLYWKLKVIRAQKRLGII